MEENENEPNNWLEDVDSEGGGASENDDLDQDDNVIDGGDTNADDMPSDN